MISRLRVLDAALWFGFFSMIALVPLAWIIKTGVLEASLSVAVLWSLIFLGSGFEDRIRRRRSTDNFIYMFNHKDNHGQKKRTMVHREEDVK